MTAILLWLIRFFILYWIIKIVYSLVRRPVTPQPPPGGSGKKTRRFDPGAKKVSEADFKEL